MKAYLVYYLLFLFLLFFLLSNFTPLNMYLPNCYPYRYCADNCQFETYEVAKGIDPFYGVEMGFEKYKKGYPEKKSTLHRRFHRKWWQIWNWYDFLSHRRWRYPYAASDDAT